jgi:hypothetical protein
MFSFRALSRNDDEKPQGPATTAGALGYKCRTQPSERVGHPKEQSRSLGPEIGPRDDTLTKRAAHSALAGAGGGSNRGSGRGAIRHEIPMLAGVLDDGGDIFYEQEAIRHERVRRLLHELQILIA